MSHKTPNLEEKVTPGTLSELKSCSQHPKAGVGWPLARRYIYINNIAIAILILISIINFHDDIIVIVSLTDIMDTTIVIDIVVAIAVLIMIFILLLLLLHPYCA